MLRCQSCGHTASFGIRNLPPGAVVFCASCGPGSRPFPVGTVGKPLVPWVDPDPRDGASPSEQTGLAVCATCGLVPKPFRVSESSEGLSCEECSVDRLRAGASMETWRLPEYAKSAILRGCLRVLLQHDPPPYLTQDMIAEAQLKYWTGCDIAAKSEVAWLFQQIGEAPVLDPAEVGRLMKDELGVEPVKKTRRRRARGYKIEAIREALKLLGQWYTERPTAA